MFSNSLRKLFILPKILASNCLSPTRNINPFFTTDTAASLRAIEIGADVLLKATKVDGVYDDDPVKNPSAKRYDTVSFDTVLADKLSVMDATAIVMCRDNNLPLRVFDLGQADALIQAISGGEVGTVVTA